jgi:hypothetical protein
MRREGGGGMPDCSQFKQAVDQPQRSRDEDLAECDQLEPRLRAGCRKQVLDRIARAEAALKNCEEGLPPAGAQSASGRVTFLRGQHRGLQAEGEPGRAFGIELDNVGGEAMFGLLRDAFLNNLDVSIDYTQVAEQVNSIAFRAALTT